MELISSNRFLDEAKINRIDVLCTDFGAKFPIYFPNRNITRKMHELVFTVPNFVKQFRTLGLLEQEGESKHAAINAELRSLSSVRSHSEKLKLVLEKEELRSFMNKSLIKGKARLCHHACNENAIRTFLRCVKDGTCCCRICEPEKF